MDTSPPRKCPECSRVFDSTMIRCPHDGSPTFISDSDAGMVGREIDGRFTIRKLLGAGGMGHVFLAHQRSMDRDVAVKMIRRELAGNEEVVRRFLREAKAASRLHNPHTVTIFDFGQTSDGLLYLVMEMLHGRPLSAFLRDSPGPVMPWRTTAIIRQVLDSLIEAHGAGILHRDLKPDNIFLLEGDGSDDFVKVLDFGIAKVVGDEGTTLTKTGKVFGTPAYMSPEQAEGKEIDARADIYAVGVILFEMLAGKPPFAAETPLALLLKKVGERPPTVVHVDPDVRIPESLETLVTRMIATDQAERPKDAREAKALLEQAERAGGEPVPLPDLLVSKGVTSSIKALRPDVADTIRETRTPATGSSSVAGRGRVVWPWIALAGAIAGIVAGLVYVWPGSDANAGKEEPLATPISPTIDATVATDTAIAAAIDQGSVPDPGVDPGGKVALPPPVPEATAVKAAGGRPEGADKGAGHGKGRDADILKMMRKVP